MFQANAGADIISQDLKFMAAQGFTAFEDNGMTGRDVAQQEKIGKTMANLEMTMGVFVAHKIYWNEPNLAAATPTNARNSWPISAIQWKLPNVAMPNGLPSCRAI